MKVEQNLDYSGLSSLITDSNEETLLLRSLDAYCFIEFWARGLVNELLVIGCVDYLYFNIVKLAMW